MSISSTVDDIDFLFEDIDDPEILESIASLPAEDDLPYDDGEPMETTRHREQMNLLIDTLNACWKDSRRYFAGGNMFLHFELDAMKKFKGPDFFLVLDVENRERKSWVVWQEKMRFPDVIIELLSDSTRNTDKKEKKELYEKVFRTHEYYLYDPYSFEFIGYKMESSRYKTVLPDKEKKIFSALTGLYLVIKDNRLRWMTTDGYILPTHEELFNQEKQKLEFEKQKVENEKRRAESAEKQLEFERLRADRLAEKLKSLGISDE